MVNQRKLNNRQEQIYNYLLLEEQLKVSDLTEKFSVVEMTIRRDLEKMEKMGIVKRTFGGAILAADLDVGFTKRESLNAHLKRQIGQKAVQFVHDGEAIFVDSGTTTPHLVKHLPKNWELVVATNALNVVAQIQGSKKEKILLGGVLHESTLSLVGPIAMSSLENLSFDKAFLSTSGLTLENGFSNANVFEVQIKRKVMEQSREVNFLVDHSKFGIQFVHKITMLEGVDRIITDKKPPDEYCRSIKKIGIDLVICNDNSFSTS
ncbi:DeoR family transcriptional regulator [Aquibacillus halophilus]|uniref:DeoR family transcriptional regulator n=1 Tax=Aquibacillus halophilus TaxID=930132 RepID=A0A6A8DF24_9BACI|nr:DeoR/GlpR family DNA-binding transcription regulator [Aquibacillus halophilus]MRH41457.1 DeoR family transcriptional regulator [Aquibacillus halophilus]